jgi:hypothetical protein
MRFRALFIGGPVDGQERVLNACPPTIDCTTVRYSRLHVIGATAIYSLLSLEETLNRVWDRYAGESDA